MGKRTQLWERIERLGMTQAQLARALKITEQSVSGWKRGEASPSGEAYIKLWDLAREISPEDALWFWEQAGIKADTAAVFLADRVNQLVRPAHKGEICLIDRFFKAEGQAEEPREFLRKDIPNPAIARYLIVDEKSGGTVFAPGDVVVLERNPGDSQDPRPFSGQIVLQQFPTASNRSPIQIGWDWPEGLSFGRLEIKQHRGGSRPYYVLVLAPPNRPKTKWLEREQDVILDTWQHPGPPKELTEGSPRAKARDEVVRADARAKGIRDRQLGRPFAGGRIMATEELEEAERLLQQARDKLTQAERAEQVKIEEDAPEQALEELRLHSNCSILGRVIAWFPKLDREANKVRE